MSDIYYSSNIKLKRVGIPVEWTKEQQIEMAKCFLSPEYFIRNYVKINHPDHGVISFQPFDYQIKLLESVTNNRYTLAKWPRQSGKSTIVTGIFLWYLLFHKNIEIAILANKETQAIELMGRLQFAYEELPFWLQQGVKEWSKKSVVCENGSKCFAAATSASAIRGRSPALLYLDEFAFAPQQDAFFASVMPTISAGKKTKVIITSTPNGLDYFYKLWKDSENGKNAFHRVEAHWSETPGRDEKWKEEQLQIMGQQRFDQEYDCQFLGSSHTLISGKKLRALVSEDPIDNDEGWNLRIYENPKEGHAYVSCVDCAEGTGNDNSAFIIVDITQLPYKLVAVYTNNEINSYLFPTVIKRVCEFYNNALCLVETNSIGSEVVRILYEELEYENVLMTSIEKNKGVSIDFGGKAKYGIRTTSLTKKIGCEKLKVIVENDLFEFHDSEYIHELSIFTLQRNSYKAEEGPGNHDDIVMCTVLFAWLQNQEYMQQALEKLRSVGESLLKQHEDSLEDQLLPLGYQDEHMPLPDVFDVYDLDRALASDDFDYM